jgi:hypothetical protein
VCDPHSVAFFLARRALAHPLVTVSRLHPWPRPFSHARCLATHCGPQRLGFRSDSFSALPAGSTQAVLPVMTSAALTTSSAPSFMRANARGFDFPHVCGSVHEPCQQNWEGKGTQVHWPLLTMLPRLPPYFIMSPARLMPIFGPQRSLSMGELCSGCISATYRVIDCTHPASSPPHATIALHLPALAM